MDEPFANREDPDQMPCSAASDLGLHCLPVVSRLQWFRQSPAFKGHYFRSHLRQRSENLPVNIKQAPVLSNQFLAFS